MAEASQAQVRAELAIAAQQLSRTQIKAPFAGRVAKRLADPGAMLASGTSLFTFVDDAMLEFRASVPSADYGKLQLGATVDVTVDAVGGRTVKGTVARISPLVDERTRSFEVTVQVPGAGPSARPSCSGWKPPTPSRSRAASRPATSWCSTLRPPWPRAPPWTSRSRRPCS